MEVKERNISELIPAEYNPRYITPEALEQLKASIQRFDAVEPVLVNVHPERKNIIISGHQRLKAAKSLGLETFPCVELNLDKDKERELNVRMNKNTGNWDWDDLGVYFESDELIEWGFTEGELFGNMELPEPDMDDLVDEEKGKEPVMKITFKDPEQLQKAETDIQELIDRKYQGAFYSVSAGEL